MDTTFFLGSNSCRGFYSLYDAFTAEPRVETLYIIKGGAGCGKSSFMRRIAAEMSDWGLDVEYVKCSGDPDSLDAVFISGVNTAYVDGTSPHVVEPLYPGIKHFYINLGAFYDGAALLPRFDEIQRHERKYKAGYARAYAALAAAEHYEKSLYGDIAAPDSVFAAAEDIMSREIGERDCAGSTKRRFLSSFSYRGRECLYDTVQSLCRKLYAVEDAYALAPEFLTRTARTAELRGHEVIVCPDPLRPNEIEHVLIPGLSLGFVTAGTDTELPLTPCGRIGFGAPGVPREGAETLAAIYARAVDGLSEAKRSHDAMERVCNPHVDFDGVYSLADEHINTLQKAVK